MVKKVITSALTITLLAMNLDAQNRVEDFRQPYEFGQLNSNEHFTGKVWLSKLSSDEQLNVPAFNVTFEPSCINSWHYHTGGQILIATAGTGYYQEQGKPARRLHAGDIVEIAPNTIHWHGAAPEHWFAHVAVAANSTTNKTIWLQPIGPEAYNQAVQESISTAKQEANKVLSPRQEAIIAIGTYTGRGDLDGLRTAIGQGLDARMTQNEIKEVLTQAYAYAGFPRALRGIQTMIDVVQERKAKGITDLEGREASPIVNQASKYERGKQILAELSGVPADAPPAGYATFAPLIERFLKEHLFADIFERDILTWQEREIATVAILAGVGGVEPMARSHMGINLRLGTTPAQLSALLDLVDIYLGKQGSVTLRPILTELSQGR